MVTGDRPRTRPSTSTRAPTGFDSTRTLAGAVPTGKSKKRDTSRPLSMRSAITCVGPPERISSACRPSGTLTVAGVTPTGSPSTRNCAPAGFDVTVRAPESASDGRATMRQPIVTIPASPTSTRAAIAACPPVHAAAS
jgi:hypothetical protein